MIEIVDTTFNQEYANSTVLYPQGKFMLEIDKEGDKHFKRFHYITNLMRKGTDGEYYCCSFRLQMELKGKVKPSTKRFNRRYHLFTMDVASEVNKWMKTPLDMEKEFKGDLTIVIRKFTEE